MFWICAAVWVAVALGRAGSRSPRPPRQRPTGDRRADSDRSVGDRRRASPSDRLDRAAVRERRSPAARSDTLRSPDALRIQVTGNQWWWDIQYQNAIRRCSVTTANEIHIPVGRPIRIDLLSDRRDPQPLDPEPAGQDRPGSRPAQRAVAAGRRRRASSAASARSTAGFSTRTWRCSVVAEPPGRLRALADRAIAQPAPPPATPEQQRGQDIVERGPCAMCHTIARHRRRRTHRARPDARRDAQHARRRHAAEHAAGTSPAGSPIRSTSSRATACRRPGCAASDLQARARLPGDAAMSGGSAALVEHDPRLDAGRAGAGTRRARADLGEPAPG